MHPVLDLEELGLGGERVSNVNGEVYSVKCSKTTRNCRGTGGAAPTPHSSGVCSCSSTALVLVFVLVVFVLVVLVLVVFVLVVVVVVVVVVRCDSYLYLYVATCACVPARVSPTAPTPAPRDVHGCVCPVTYRVPSTISRIEFAHDLASHE